MNYGYETAVADAAAGSILAGFGFTIIFAILFCIFLFACMYKIYKKAGKKGWEAIIPIYNMIVLMQIVGLPTWYIVLYFIPFANIYVMFKTYIELAHKFGKSTGFGVLMIFFSFVCLPILAFGDDKYNGYNEKTHNMNANDFVQGVESNVTASENIKNIDPSSQNLNMMNTENLNKFNVEPNNFDGQVNGLNQNIIPEVDSGETINGTSYETQTLGSNAQDTYLNDPKNEVNVQKEIEQAPIIMNNQVNTPVNQTHQVSNITPSDGVPSSSELVEEISSINPVHVQTEMPKKFCPNCGKQLDQNDVMCFMCGHKF